MNLNRGLRSRIRKLLPQNLTQTARSSWSKDVLIVDWVNRGPVKNNWGDAIAPLLANKLSGRTIVNHRDVIKSRQRSYYTTIGSMLGSIEAPGAIVWGSGFVSSGHSMKVRPRRVCAVRGPLTRRKLIEDGIDCPEIFGDPALLYPMFFQPERSDRYRLGVIPHFRETTMSSVQRLSEEEGVVVIDIRSGITQVAELMNQCSRVASASLHGLVACDAYGIPGAWVQFSDRPSGDGFKFYDYLASIGRSDHGPLQVSALTSVDEIEDHFTDYRVDIDLDRFLRACPFLNPDLLDENRIRPLR